jgi:hypothetical protein
MKLPDNVDWAKYGPKLVRALIVSTDAVHDVCSCGSCGGCAMMKRHEALLRAVHKHEKKENEKRKMSTVRN